MLTKRKMNLRDKVEVNCLEQLVPKNHLLRKIDKVIDFNFIYKDVENLYSEVGRPSIDPVVLIKIVMIQYLFGIPSMRQTIKEIEVNIAYRWFIGYSISEAIPHFSTFSKNYERRFKNSEVFNNIFLKILEIARENKLISAEQIYIDSTHIKASANKKKYKKLDIKIETKNYQQKLNDEINKDRIAHGKKPFADKEIIKTKAIVKSTTDEESGMFYKTEKEKCFAYLSHTACDNNNFILGFEVTPGNVHDSVAFESVYTNVLNRYSKEIIAVAIDAGYVNPHIAKIILDSNVLPSMPYKRPMTQKGFLRKYEYIYDEFYDCYLCPNNCLLKYSTTNRDGYKEYKANPFDCIKCPLRSQCTKSKNNQKVILRHVWQESLDEAQHLRFNNFIKSVYKRRKETIERIFADAKEKHGMRFTHLRSLAKVKFEVTLIFACMNLKKLATKLWKSSIISTVLYYLSQLYKKTISKFIFLF